MRNLSDFATPETAILQVRWTEHLRTYLLIGRRLIHTGTGDHCAALE